MDKDKKRLSCLALFTFLLLPLLAWGSVLASDETAVFASLSRMIWYSGSSAQIFIAMAVLFIPMMVSFFLAHQACDMSRRRKIVLRIGMIASVIVLYLGAMWVMPSDGKTVTIENIWHGILSFAGMLMIFLTYCLYTVLIWRKNREEAGLLAGFLTFTLFTGLFAALNVFDDRSYVMVSAVSELYVLTMMSLIGYLTYYLACRKKYAETKMF